jgi:hypothetical protein
MVILMLNRGGISQTLKLFLSPAFILFYFRLRRGEGVGTTKQLTTKES